MTPPKQMPDTHNVAPYTLTAMRVVLTERMSPAAIASVPDQSENQPDAFTATDTSPPLRVIGRPVTPVS